MTIGPPPAEPRRAATVEFEHVTKRYDARARRTPRAPSTTSRSTVPAGKICVLVGPSGCGKTTSAQDGQPAHRADVRPASSSTASTSRRATSIELRRGIGYVIQQVGLFPHQTIGENVGDRAAAARLAEGSPARSGPRSCSRSSGSTRRAIATAIPAQLSGGERQRVGVARALAADPPMMLMDEPFGAVDPIVRERLQNEFLRLQEELAKTILFVTHDIDEAIKMGDLVAVMQVGRHPRPVRAAGRDPRRTRVGVRRPVRRRGPRPEAPVAARGSATSSSAAPSRPASATTPPTPATATSPSAFPYLLLVDARRPADRLDRRSPTSRPAGRSTPTLAEPMSPLLDRRTTLKDALSMLLDADVQAGVVVDRTGAVAASSRSSRSPT